MIIIKMMIAPTVTTTPIIIVCFCFYYEYHHDTIFYAIAFASWPQSTQVNQQPFAAS